MFTRSARASSGTRTCQNLPRRGSPVCLGALNASAAGSTLPVSRCGRSVKFQINSQTEQTQPVSAPRRLAGRGPGDYHLVFWGGNFRPELKDLRVLC